MNEEFWASGVIETSQGQVAWPGMTKLDAGKLSPVSINRRILTDRFQSTDISLSDVPFILQVIVPEGGKVGSITALLSMEPQFSRNRYGVEFPVAEELSFYENLFEKYLGSTNHKHTRSWGAIEIVEDPWTHDPYIAVSYHV